MEPVNPKNGKNFLLPEAQALIGGYVRLATLRKDLILVCDEDGLAKGLKPNQALTKTLRAEGIAYTIVGPALLCHPRQLK